MDWVACEIFVLVDFSHAAGPERKDLAQVWLRRGVFPQRNIRGQTIVGVFFQTETERQVVVRKLGVGLLARF